MNKTINIPHKKVQPSPQFKPLVAGEGVTLEELNQRITEISATGGGGGGQRIVVSPDMPTDLKENDFWYEVKQMQAYCSVINGVIPYFLIVSEDPIEILEDSCVILDNKTYPINSTYGYFENLNMLTAEMYEILVDELGFQIPTSIIGQYAGYFDPERMFDFITYGNRSVLFKIGNRYSNIVEYECDLILQFVNVGNDYSANKYLLTNGDLTLEDLQNGSFNSGFFSFDAPTAKIDQEYAQQTGIGEEYIGLYATQLVIDETIPNGIYNVIYEYSGIEAALSINILYTLIANTENSEFMLIMSMDFDEEGLEISLDGTTLTTDQYDVYPWCSTLNQTAYENYVDDFPALEQQYVGCKYSMFTINNLDLGAHTIIASNSNQSAEIVLPDRIDYLCFTAVDAGSTISMTHNGTNQSTTKPVIYYSRDKQIWNIWDNSAITLSNIGDKIWLYGDNTSGFSRSWQNYSMFVMTGKIAAIGNIMTLISKDQPTIIPSNACFYRLFMNCTLTTAPELTATTLKTDCYWEMFLGCNLLVSGPVLYATNTVGSCYERMFGNCSSLTSVTTYATTNVGFNNWLNGVSNSGIVYCKSTLNLPSDSASGIPSGWTRIDL